MPCPLCKQNYLISVSSSEAIQLWKCANCKLISKDSSLFPALDDEKERYLKHHNSHHNKGYIQFLNQALEPTYPYLPLKASGIDYGCGPSPVLASLLQEKGFDCDLYDPFFYPSLPTMKKDFVFATESFEHFFDPEKELHLISSLLLPGGVLTIMTERWNDEVDFATWWYVRDVTHVSFFHDRTIEYICEHYGFSILYDDGVRVVVLQKK